MFIHFCLVKFITEQITLESKEKMNSISIFNCGKKKLQRILSDFLGKNSNNYIRKPEKMEQ